MKQRITKLFGGFLLILLVESSWCFSVNEINNDGVSEHIQAIKSINGTFDKDSLGVYMTDLSIKISKSEISLNDALAIHVAFKKVIIRYPQYKELDYLLYLIEIYIAGNSKDIPSFEGKIMETRQLLSKANRLAHLIRFNVEIGHYQYANGMLGDCKRSYLAVEELIKATGFNRLEPIGKLFATINANSFGLYYSDEKQYDSASYYFFAGLKRAKDIKSDVWEGIISGNLGTVMQKAGRLKEAEILLIKDYQNSRKNNEVGSAIHALFSLSDIKIAMGDFEAAMAYLDTASIDLQKVGKDDIDFRNNFKFEMNYRLGLLALSTSNLKSAQDFFNETHQHILKEQDRLHSSLRAFNSNRYLIENNAYKVFQLEKERERNLFILGVFSLLIVLAVVMVYLQIRYNKTLREKNKEIAEQAKGLTALNEQKSKLFSIVAHDVRGPIGVLSKLLELYKENDITEDELIKYSSQVGDTLGSLNVMLDNLLNWARSSMENGLAPRKERVNITNISNDIIKQLQPQINLKGIEVNIKNQAKDILIETDPAFLTVIIRNLLSNAIKYTQPNTQIGMHILLDEKENKVEISISDKGLGLSEQAIQEILQSNTGVMSKPGTKGELGSGIGLMLCKEFTKSLGGQLSAQSQLNVGTTFKVSLPIR